jgi:hypothetical protein
LVAETTLLRGQTGPLMGVVANPWFIAAAVATATAVPVALINNRDPEPRS